MGQRIFSVQINDPFGWQRKRDTEELQRRAVIDQNFKYAYDASLGKLVPVNPSLEMLPGLGGSAIANSAGITNPLTLPMATRTAPAGSTYITSGAGVTPGYYMPKLERTKYAPATQEEEWSDITFKTNEAIRRDKNRVSTKGQPKVTDVIKEKIIKKVYEGQSLNSGEQKIYDDIIKKSSLLEQLLGGQQGQSIEDGAEASPYTEYPDAFMENGQWKVLRDGKKYIIQD